MSSYELLELFGYRAVPDPDDVEKRLIEVDFAPEDGAVAKARRDGDWPEWVKILAELHKEDALYHAAKYRQSDKSYKATVFLSPVERRERAERELAEALEHQEAETDFYAQQGWT